MSRRSYILFSILLFSSSAFAADYLTLTDIVERRRADLRIDYTLSRFDATRARAGFLSTDIEASRSESELEIRYGLVTNLHLTLRIPYLVGEKSDFSTIGIPLATTKRGGWGDLTVGGRFKIVEEGTRRPAWVMEILTKLDSASDQPPEPDGAKGGAGTGRTDYLFSTAVSKRFSRAQPYVRAVYEVTGKDSSGFNESDSITLQIGDEVVSSEDLSIDFRLGATRFGERRQSGFTLSEKHYSLQAGLQLFAHVTSRITLIPSFEYAIVEDFDIFDPLADVSRTFQDQKFYSVGIGFYVVLGPLPKEKPPAPEEREIPPPSPEPAVPAEPLPPLEKPPQE